MGRWRTNTVEKSRFYFLFRCQENSCPTPNSYTRSGTKDICKFVVTMLSNAISSKRRMLLYGLGWFDMV